MKRDSTKPAADAADARLFDNWFDPIETSLRRKVRGFIETLVGAISSVMKLSDHAARSMV